MENRAEGMLGVYRVLDLTNEHGYLCGKILGDLGADVIKIEKPGGDPGRSIGPFYHDIPDPEKSLYWFAFNTSKRGITLDIETVDGREIFKRLVKKADVVLESFQPGYMDQLGLGYSTLSQINPGIIMTSITGFGQTGPYKDYKAPDIVVWALSGNAYITGEPDRAPLESSFPIAYLAGAGPHAAVGTMVALYQREVTGEGQHVDTSAQLSLILHAHPDFPALWENDGINIKRSGKGMGAVSGREMTAVSTSMIYQCKDGYITFTGLLAPYTRGGFKAFQQWMESEGMAGETLKKIDWDTFKWEDASPDLINEIIENWSKFFSTHTRVELLEGAVQRRIQLYPLYTPEDNLELSQLKYREYWVKVEHPELGTAITYPGAIAILSETPCQIRRRAPLIGEHNDEIYIEEFGLSSDELLTLKQAKVI